MREVPVSRSSSEIVPNEDSPMYASLSASFTRTKLAKTEEGRVP